MAKKKKKTAGKKAAKKKATPKSKVAKKKATKKKAKKTVTKKKATKKKATKKKAKKKPATKKASRKKITKAKPKPRVKPVKPSRTIVVERIPTLELEKFEATMPMETGVEDKTLGSTTYAWIGSGQCGGRIVKSVYDLGYKKVIAVNTTHHDLDHLNIPKVQKLLMHIGSKGAGKDMNKGRTAVNRAKQDILHLARKTFGTNVDHVMVCLGAGGGTGSGSATELVDVAKNYARSVGHVNPNQTVGVVLTLPTLGEASSPKVRDNAHNVATELGQMAASGAISPLIIVDNEKISRMYPGLTVKEFWPSINSTVSGLFDVFNRLSALSSRYTTFDAGDYQSIFRAGGCAIMGLTKVTNFTDKFSVSEAVKRNLEKTLLAGGFDLSTAKVAGCIVVGGKKMMANVPGLQDNINFAFDVLADLTGNATVHRGIYEDSRESLRVYTVIGGLDFPSARVEELLTRNATYV